MRKRNAMAAVLAVGLSLSTLSVNSGKNPVLAVEEVSAPLESSQENYEDDGFSPLSRYKKVEKNDEVEKTEDSGKKAVKNVATASSDKAEAPSKSKPHDADIPINEANFPDEGFRNYVREFDIDDDYILSLDELSDVYSIDCSELNIKSLVGINYFFNLYSLNCQNNKLSSLELSTQSGLQVLECGNNALTSLDVSNFPRLYSLDCNSNKLTSLDVSNNSDMSVLFTHGNNIAELNVTNCASIVSLMNNGEIRDRGSYYAFVDPEKWDEEYFTFDKTTVVTPEFKEPTPTPSPVPINKTNFPDNAFREVVTGFDTNNNKKLDSKEIDQVFELWCSGKDIKSLKGIAYFSKLRDLYCDGNQLTSLDLSGNKYLWTLNCSDNKLTDLDISKNADLCDFSCNNNKLTKLDISKNTNLGILNCANNNLTSLNLSANESLNTLDCSFNSLTSLDVKNNPQLYWLFTHNNKLSKLDVSKCEYITGIMENGSVDDHDTYYMFLDPEKFDTERFSFDKKTVLTPRFKMPSPTPTPIKINKTNFPDKAFRDLIMTSEFDLDQNMMIDHREIAQILVLRCPQHDIKSLKGVEFFTKLVEVDCSKNLLTELDLSKNTHLQILDCRMNDLTKLNISKCSELTSLNCSQNKISKLNLTKMEALNSLNCSQNQLTELDVTQNVFLDVLKCDHNKIKTLKTGDYAFITYLDCSDNAITSLIGLTLESLKYFNCSKNELTKLDVSFAPELETLLTHSNNISKLDVSGNEKILDVMNNGDVKVRDTYYAFVYPSKPNTEVFTFDMTTSVAPGFRKPTSTPTPTSRPVTPTVTATPTPTITPTPVESGEGFEGFVDRLYKIALERDPDSEGKAFWVKHVKEEGATGADCARFFLLDAPEFLKRGQTDDQFLDTLYAVFFDRDSDESGKKFWKDKLAAGTSKSDVVNGFIESTEWCNVCSSFGVKSGAKYHKATIPSANAKAFATRLYTKCLGRKPETEGLNYWALALTNLDKTASDAALFFFTSEEFVGFKTTDEEYLGRLYYTFMDREPDQGGIQFWLSKISQGTTRDEILKNFAESPEFTTICKQYGIDRGTIG